MSALVADSYLDPLPLEVTFSRIMCADVGESRMAPLAGLGVIFPCSLGGAGGPVGLVWWAAALGRTRLWLVGKGGQAER